jgi:hypothetical protein
MNSFHLLSVRGTKTISPSIGLWKTDLEVLKWLKLDGRSEKGQVYIPKRNSR